MSDIHEQIKAQYEAYLNEAQSFDEKGVLTLWYILVFNSDEYYASRKMLLLK